MCHVLNRDKVDIFRTQPQRHEPKLLGVPHEQPLSTHHQPAHDLRQRGEAACWVSCMCFNLATNKPALNGGTEKKFKEESNKLWQYF